MKNGTPAIGRTPVVRVDAFLTSNAGEKKLVASSYIKLEITETSQAPDEKPDYGIIDMSADKAADYHKLEGGEKHSLMTIILIMSAWTIRLSTIRFTVLQN